VLKLEGEKTASRPNSQTSMGIGSGFAAVFIHTATQLPIPPLYDSIAREFLSVIKVTVGDVVDLQWGGKNVLVSDDFHRLISCDHGTRASFFFWLSIFSSSAFQVRALFLNQFESNFDAAKRAHVCRGCFQFRISNRK